MQSKRLYQCSSHDDQAGATQSSAFSPPTRRNSWVLCVTSVALSASAWQAIHRSFAPLGVPASFRRVNCSAQCSQMASLQSARERSKQRRRFAAFECAEL